MQKKQASKMLDTFCEPCELRFSVGVERIDEHGKEILVACPRCNRKARVVRLQDGRIQVKHNQHIFVCPRPLSHNPLMTAIVYFSGIVVLTLVFAAVSRMVNPYLCPVVFGTAFLAIGVIGAIQLALAGGLNKSFVESMRIFYKGLPYLLGKNPPGGKIDSEDKAFEAQPQPRPK